MIKRFCIGKKAPHRICGAALLLLALFSDGEVKIVIKDKGCGIEDVKMARQPLFTTDAENERSGMGFTVMESFMDKLEVKNCKTGLPSVIPQ